MLVNGRVVLDLTEIDTLPAGVWIEDISTGLDPAGPVACLLDPDALAQTAWMLQRVIDTQY